MTAGIWLKSSTFKSKDGPKMTPHTRPAAQLHCHYSNERSWERATEIGQVIMANCVGLFVGTNSKVAGFFCTFDVSINYIIESGGIWTKGERKRNHRVTHSAHEQQQQKKHSIYWARARVSERIHDGLLSVASSNLNCATSKISITTIMSIGNAAHINYLCFIFWSIWMDYSLSLSLSPSADLSLSLAVFVSHRFSHWHSSCECYERIPIFRRYGMNKTRLGTVQMFSILWLLLTNSLHGNSCT